MSDHRPRGSCAGSRQLSTSPRCFRPPQGEAPEGRVGESNGERQTDVRAAGGWQCLDPSPRGLASAPRANRKGADARCARRGASRNHQRVPIQNASESVVATSHRPSLGHPTTPRAAQYQARREARREARSSALATPTLRSPPPNRAKGQGGSGALQATSRAAITRSSRPPRSPRRGTEPKGS